jgi:hypothetical protein
METGDHHDAPVLRDEEQAVWKARHVGPANFAEHLPEGPRLLADLDQLGIECGLEDLAQAEFAPGVPARGASTSAIAAGANQSSRTGLPRALSAATS